MEQNRAIPVLPAQNLQKAIEFYGNLGFQPAAEFENYAIVCRGSLEIHLSLLPTIVPTESYAECYLRVTNIDELFQEFTQLSLPVTGIPRIGTLENQPWGMREFYLIDLSGNLLRIGQEVID